MLAIAQRKKMKFPKDNLLDLLGVKCCLHIFFSPANPNRRRVFILRIKNIEIPSNLTRDLTLVCALGTFISSVLSQFSKVVFLGSL